MIGRDGGKEARAPAIWKNLWVPKQTLNLHYTSQFGTKSKFWNFQTGRTIFILETALCLCLSFIHTHDTSFSLIHPTLQLHLLPSISSFSICSKFTSHTGKKMETRAAAKRKANAATIVFVEKQYPNKRQRVVLGELPNLQNLIVSETQNSRKEKLLCRKNPNEKKPSPTNNNTFPSPQINESYDSDIHGYLREMEVILILFKVNNVVALLWLLDVSILKISGFSDAE